MRAVAAPHGYSRNGFHAATPKEIFSGEDSEPDTPRRGEAVKENDNIPRSSSASACKTQKRAVRTGVGVPHLTGAPMGGDVSSAPSAPSMPGKRRTTRTSSNSPAAMPVASNEEEANLMKRSLTTPSLTSSERRSKSRGETKLPGTADLAGIEPRDLRNYPTRKASPPGHAIRHSEHRVPKRTPRLSPRSSLMNRAKDGDDRHVQSWEARRRAPPSAHDLGEARLTGTTTPPGVLAAAGSTTPPHRASRAREARLVGSATPPMVQVGSTSVDAALDLSSAAASEGEGEVFSADRIGTSRQTPDLPPSNFAQQEEEFASAVMLPGEAYHTLTSAQMTPPGRHSRHPYEGNVDERDYQHVGPSSSISGATTPTESCDLPLLRLRPDSKVQQAQDSRIMKLIGRRSVLNGGAMTSDVPHAGVGRRRDRDQRQQQRHPQPRGSTPGSPSSPPKVPARPSVPGSHHSREAPLLATSDIAAAALGEMNRKGDAPAPRGTGAKTPKTSLGDEMRKTWGGSANANDENIAGGIRSNTYLGYVDTKAQAPGGATLAGGAAVASIHSGAMEEMPQEARASNPREVLSATAPSSAYGGSAYPVDADDGGLPLDLTTPSFGLSVSDRVATLRHASSGTILPLPEDGEAGASLAQQARESGLDAQGVELQRLAQEGELDSSSAATTIGALQEPTLEAQLHGEPALAGELQAQPVAQEDVAAGAAAAMPAGASQVDPSLLGAGGSQGAIIWPGRTSQVKQEVVEQPVQYVVPGAGPAWGVWPAHPTALMPELGHGLGGHMWAAQPTMLQNEAGSLVVPHTWRYVPPPPQAAPTPAQPASPGSASSPGPVSPPSVRQAGAESSNASPEANGQPETSAPAPEEAPAPEARPLDSTAKRHLLAELIECLTARAVKAEKALGSQQRETRAAHVTIEVLQRQNLGLQQQLQQLAWVAQSWPYANLAFQGVEDPQTALVATAGALPQGTTLHSSAPLPVESATMRLDPDKLPPTLQ